MTNESMQPKAELPIFIKWYDFVGWLLLTTEKFPKKARFSLAERLNILGLDMVEDLIEAKYSRDKARILQKSNLRLEKIRVLLRICSEQKYIAHESYKRAMYTLNEVGAMVGGWQKQQSGRQGS
jgi:hypothetical protein